MAIAFRFRRIDTPAAPVVNWLYEGNALTACEGDTVAAALLASGIDYTRTTPVNNTPRAPFCMMGTCFDCLMDIDGVPNQQACQMVVTEGMVVRRMLGARDSGHE
ncbi:MAG: (2Fe-2S)-binding protein [Granulosicoccaceae bacterium]